jgi:hypothetical protein
MSSSWNVNEVILFLFYVHTTKTSSLIDYGIRVLIQRRLNLPAENYFPFHVFLGAQSSFLMPFLTPALVPPHCGRREETSSRKATFFVIQFTRKKGRKLHERFPLNYNILLTFASTNFVVSGEKKGSNRSFTRE